MKKTLCLFFVFLFFVIGLSAAEEKKEEKKEDIFKIKVIGGLLSDLEASSNQTVGYWGFADPSIEKQYLGGYMFGMIMSLRFSEYIDLFMDINIVRASLLMGKAGSYLKGIAIWDADPNHTDSISPTLPNDIYYISKSTMGRIGARFIYPINNIFEPYIGIAAGMVPYEIGFGNQDGSRAYSEILTDIATIYSFILGTDLNLIIDNQKFMTFGVFFEYGGSVTEVNTIMHDWIWQGWTYHAQFIIVPVYRFGLTLTFNL